MQHDLELILTRLPRLRERAYLMGGALSGAEQQMLALARGWMARPRLMMLDEPSIGLSPMFVHEIYELIYTLPGEGISVLLVEQNANAALSIAHRAVLMHLGMV
ncbi:MAG TPA: ATP-binding cassette domain-containing protein, partial [Planctomycetota bacterium]|nr:ATP-binding cassette domain-containing protein [Planctomycetota bacterium]